LWSLTHLSFYPHQRTPSFGELLCAPLLPIASSVRVRDVFFDVPPLRLISLSFSPQIFLSASFLSSEPSQQLFDFLIRPICVSLPLLIDVFIELLRQVHPIFPFLASVHVVSAPQQITATWGVLVLVAISMPLSAVFKFQLQPPILSSIFHVLVFDVPLRLIFIFRLLIYQPQLSSVFLIPLSIVLPQLQHVVVFLALLVSISPARFGAPPPLLVSRYLAQSILKSFSIPLIPFLLPLLLLSRFPAIYQLPLYLI
jgi:hypothetical protein